MTGSMCPHPHQKGEAVCPFCPGVEVKGRECPCCGTTWGRSDGRPWIRYGPAIIPVQVDTNNTKVVRLEEVLQ
jgi:hypothetical protein